MGDRLHKDSGVISESGGWRHRCGYGEKEKILQDVRNMFICYIFSTGSSDDITIKDFVYHYFTNKHNLYWKTRFVQFLFLLVQ